MEPLERRCPLCREVADFGGTLAARAVELRVNLVPMGTYESPAHRAMYRCRSCGHSFALLPAVGRVLFVLSALAGIPFLALAAFDHGYGRAGDSVAIVVLGVVLLLVGTLGFGRDALLRRRTKLG